MYIASLFYFKMSVDRFERKGVYLSAGCEPIPMYIQIARL
jgi:hypothetical protein